MRNLRYIQPPCRDEGSIPSIRSNSDSISVNIESSFGLGSAGCKPSVPKRPIRRRDQTLGRIAEELPSNLSLSNQELAVKFGCSVQQIETLIYGMGLKRTPEQRQAIASRQNAGNSNPRWKGGIAKDHYHWKKLQVTRYPERVIARRKVHRAVKSGKLTRLPCEHPGCDEVVTFAHHDDYSKPLDVRWLCRAHHIEADKQRRVKEVAA